MDASDERVVVVFQERVFEFEPEVIQIMLDALAEIPRRVMWIAHSESQLEGHVIPKNVRVWYSQFVFSLLPHPKIDAFITCGGINSHLEGLWHGIPTVCMGAYSDQHEDCFSLQRAGTGVALHKKEVTIQLFKDAVTNLLEHPEFRENAAQYGRILRTDGGPTRAAELIENLVFIGKSDHLIPYGVHMSWWQRDCLDVGGCICALFFLIASVFATLVWRCCCSGSNNAGIGL